jgi:heat shock protein HslJ
VKLQEGISEVPAAPGSDTVVTTRYFGNEVEYDFDGNGTMDAAFIVTQDTGGSGTFYYVVAALNTPEGYVGSNAVFLGDRVAPQSTRMNPDTPGVIEVAFVDRAPGEDFSVVPSIGKSIQLTLDTQTMQLGTTDTTTDEGGGTTVPSALTDKPWQWVRTNYTDGRVFAPKQATAFVITFNQDGSMSATTDCNGVSGSYTAVADSLAFGALATTMMFCDGSEEGVFNELLGTVSTYRFTVGGELELGLKAGEGVMILK